MFNINFELGFWKSLPTDRKSDGKIKKQTVSNIKCNFLSAGVSWKGIESKP